jgi:hypothetical protein
MKKTVFVQGKICNFQSPEEEEEDVIVNDFPRQFSKDE